MDDDRDDQVLELDPGVFKRRGDCSIYELRSALELMQVKNLNTDRIVKYGSQLYRLLYQRADLCTCCPRVTSTGAGGSKTRRSSTR